MLLRLPSRDGPLHERIAAAVRRAISDGELEVGDRLPPARDLAEGLGVNVNTVLRAYRALRDEGVVDLRRGRGATVTSAAGERARLVEQVDLLLTEARRAGLDRQELHELLEERA